jgi:hypothetical protein
MSFLALGKILDGAQGVKRDGADYLVAEELDAQIFISLGHEVLQIPRLQRVTLGQEVVTMATHTGERFYFPPEQIVGLKFGGKEAKAARTGAGFR